MFGFIHNYRVGVRLGSAFAILLLALAAFGAITLYNMSRMQARLDEIVLVNDAKTALLQRMLETTQRTGVLLRDAVLSGTEGATEHASTLETLRSEFSTAWTALERMPTDVEGRRLRDLSDQARKAVAPVDNQVMELAAAGDTAAAARLLKEEAVPGLEAWRTPLRENLALQVRSNETDYAAAKTRYDSVRIQLLAIIVVALLVGVLMARLITRSLTDPLQQATRLAGEIAEGRLDGKVLVHGRDELAALLESMKVMQSTLHRFSAAQDEIAHQHEAGEIDHRIPAEEFEGAYGAMAQQVNDLVDSHIQAVLDVNVLIDEYARGDLSRDFPRMPGKKAAVTEAMDAVKANMTAVNTEIRQLVDAAVAGDFSRRGDAARFEFAYRAMIENLNTLMDSADRGLGEVGTLLTAVADGDLTRRADEQLPGQFGQLAADANRSVEQLSAVVGRIRQGSDSISAAASEIAAGNNDLSQRTEQQAASLEETASSMEELTSTVRQNADNARQASTLATGAASVAEQGGQVVDQVVGTMGAINASSRRIVDIISVIDGIAFQTNILALNAAVEAARAGEQGRGFAVVASEVRSLAQRSAAAAKEIKQLIDDSVEKVESGTELVDRAGRTMGEIVDSVKRVNDIIADIAAASQEQSAGIEQINQAVLQMDEGTQQNAALVEEASAAARSLEQQSTQLVQAVATFRMDGGHAAIAPAPAITRMATPAPAAAPARPPAAVRTAAVRPRQPLAAAAADQRWQEF